MLLKKAVRKSVPLLAAYDTIKGGENHEAEEPASRKGSAVDVPGTDVVPSDHVEPDRRAAKAEVKATKKAAREERRDDRHERIDGRKEARLLALKADGGVYRLESDKVVFNARRGQDKTYALSSSTTAQLEISGQVVATSARSTLSRELALGIFASQKKGKIVDRRHIFISVVDDDWSILIKGAPQLETQFREWMHRLEQFTRAFERAEPAEPAAPSSPVLDQLERLGELRDKGLLTEEEFVTQKIKLLT